MNEWKISHLSLWWKVRLNVILMVECSSPVGPPSHWRADRSWKIPPVTNQSWIIQGCLFLEGLHGLHIMEKSPLKDRSTCQVVCFMEYSIKWHTVHNQLFVTIKRQIYKSGCMFHGRFHYLSHPVTVGSRLLAWRSLPLSRSPIQVLTGLDMA